MRHPVYKQKLSTYFRKRHKDVFICWKGSFCTLKGHVLHGKRPSFARRKVTFWTAINIWTWYGGYLKGEKKNGNHPSSVSSGCKTLIVNTLRPDRWFQATVIPVCTGYASWQMPCTSIRTHNVDCQCFTLQNDRWKMKWKIKNEEWEMKNEQ